eukprot:jgi/Psemu1/58676/gm1.58676_g
MADRAERNAARNAERARRLCFETELERNRCWLLAEQQQAARNQQQAARNQEIEIEFDSDDDTSSEDTSSEDMSSEENKDTDDSDEEDPSESSWSDDNSKMSYLKVPKLPCDGEVNFEGWYRMFLTHASSRKNLTMVSAKVHTNLPLEGELTEYSDMNKAQKKALKAHSKALNDLLIAFEHNPAGEAIIEKSKIDREGSWEDNAKITLQWPREDLRSIKMSMTKNPKGVFQEPFRVVQRYQYKTIKPTPDDLYATILCALPKYLKMETIVEDLYNNMLVKGITTASSHKDMTLFNAEFTDIVAPDKRDKKANDNNESNNNSYNNNSNGGQHGRPKCSICGGKHRDVMCWEDDRNAHQRPPNWKPKKKSDMQGAVINFDFCL